MNAKKTETDLPRTRCTDCGKVIKKGEPRHVFTMFPKYIDPNQPVFCYCSHCDWKFGNAMCN